MLSKIFFHITSDLQGKMENRDSFSNLEHNYQRKFPHQQVIIISNLVKNDINI